MKHKLEIGTEVKVVKPDETAREFIGTMGKVTEYEDDNDKEPFHKVEFGKEVEGYDHWYFLADELEVINEPIK